MGSNDVSIHDIDLCAISSDHLVRAVITLQRKVDFEDMVAWFNNCKDAMNLLTFGSLADAQLI